MKYVTILILQLLILTKAARSQFNPCPGLVDFKSEGGQKVAVITIPPPGKGIVIMNVTIEFYGSSMGKPSLRLAKSLDETAKNAANGQDIQYIYTFPRAVEEFPRITEIILNGRDICTDPGESRPGTRTTWPTSRTIYIPSDAKKPAYIPYHLIKTNRNPQDTILPNRGANAHNQSWVYSLSSADICGKMARVEVLTQLIINGIEVLEGEFPWMVAMYRTGFEYKNYICGGTLISDKYIVTAAHCTKNEPRVFLEIGRHDISNQQENSFERRTSLSIFNSPSYVTAPEDDIALILVRRVEFTNKIKPICLWPLATRAAETTLHGQVTGWGITENGDQDSTATVPNKVAVKSASANRCRNSHPLYQNINVNKSFCAGGEKAGPCVGDSGGGMYVRNGNIWYLRGIVSVSVGEFRACNLETYAIYTDVSYYMDWLEAYLS